MYHSTADLKLVCQRVWSNLEVDYFGVGPFSGFTMEGGACTPGGPHSFALPSGLGVVEAPIHSFGVEPQGIGHAQYGELAVDQGDQRIRRVAGDDRDVFP